MLDLLRDNESIPLPKQPKPIKLFDLDSASEQDLKEFLLSSNLQNFNELDSSLESINSLCIFTQDTLDYFTELYPQCRQFSQDQTEILIILYSSTYIILNLNPSQQSLNLMLISQENPLIDYDEVVTKVINTLLHWLWLRLNSY